MLQQSIKRVATSDMGHPALSAIPGPALVGSLDGAAAVPTPGRTLSVADVGMHSVCGEVVQLQLATDQ